MTFTVEIDKAALKQLKKLDKPIRLRVFTAIEKLADDPRPPGVRKLQHQEDFWRIRVGNYRVIYEIHDSQLVVFIVHVDHQSSVYDIL